MKRQRLLIAMLLFLGACAVMSMFCGITPKEMTVTAIGETFYRIHLYAKLHNELPESLDDLPVRENYMNRTTDGWGNELIYSVDATGTVTLTSLGADAKPGGTEDNADLSETHKWLNNDGNFLADDDLWTVNSRVP